MRMEAIARHLRRRCRWWQPPTRISRAGITNTFFKGIDLSVLASLCRQIFYNAAGI
jgi:hypothetical protein